MLLNVILAVIGLVPVVITALGALGSDASATRMLAALIAYAAIGLALLGGLFLAGAGASETPGQRRWFHLGLGVGPAIAGWVAILLPGWLALVVLIAGYVVLGLAERQAVERGLVMPGYRALRWTVMIVIVAMLTTVLTLRLLGQTITI